MFPQTDEVKKRAVVDDEAQERMVILVRQMMERFLMKKMYCRTIMITELMVLET